MLIVVSIFTTIFWTEPINQNNTTRERGEKIFCFLWLGSGEWGVGNGLRLNSQNNETVKFSCEGEDISH